MPAPAGATTDLSVKPVIKADPAPPPTEVTVADIVVGKGAEATTLSSVEAKYVGALYTDGTEFDSSWKTSPDTTIPFTVCGTGTIPGFAIGPTGMRVGGRRQITIPAKLGYGEQGSPPAIPANAPLVFVIDLVKVTPPAG
jgi:peptidylprolyl isomerase